jgi:5'-3' exonuclease
MVSFAKMAKQAAGDPDNIMLVDFLNLSFRYKHRDATAPFSDEILRTIQSLAKSYACGTVILCADFGSSSYRKNVDPGYKAGRKDKYKDQTEEEVAEFRKFLENYETAYEFCIKKYIGVRLKNVEADDTIAYFSKHLRDDEDINKVVIISTDADMDQLLDDYVMRFSYKTRKEYTVHNFFDEHGCDNPEQYTSLKVLKGDSGDSVPGIENVGDKRGFGLIRQYGTAMDIYDHIPLEGKQKFIQNINESGELIPKNYELMDLLSFCEDAIAFPDPDNIKAVESVLAEVKRRAA